MGTHRPGTRARRRAKRFANVLEQRIQFVPMAEAIHLLATSPRMMAAVESWIAATGELLASSDCCDESRQLLGQLLRETTAEYANPADDDLKRGFCQDSGIEEGSLPPEELALDAIVAEQMIGIIEAAWPRIDAMLKAAMALREERAARMRADARAAATT